MSAPGIVREGRGRAWRGRARVRGGHGPAVAHARPGCTGLRLPPAGQGGYTVVEVLVAAVLMSFVLVGLAMLYSEGQTFVVAEGDDRVAIVLARKKIEALRNLGFACIPPAASPGTLHVPQSPEPGCPDTDETRAARKYNEDKEDDCGLLIPLSPAAPCEGPPRFKARLTTVQCADPLTLATVACPAAGKRITVEVYPVLARARAVRAEAFLALR